MKAGSICLKVCLLSLAIACVQLWAAPSVIIDLILSWLGRLRLYLEAVKPSYWHHTLGNYLGKILCGISCGSGYLRPLSMKKKLSRVSPAQATSSDSVFYQPWFLHLVKVCWFSPLFWPFLRWQTRVLKIDQMHHTIPVSDFLPGLICSLQLDVASLKNRLGVRAAFGFWVATQNTPTEISSVVQNGSDQPQHWRLQTFKNIHTPESYFLEPRGINQRKQWKKSWSHIQKMLVPILHDQLS